MRPSGTVPPPETTPDPRPRGCPVCGRPGGRVLHTPRLGLPDQFDLPRTFDVVCCPDCGMVYSDVNYTSAQIQAYYAADTYEFGQGPGPAVAAEPPSSRTDRDRLAGLARYIAGAFADRSIRILDVGCASGVLLSLLRGEGFSQIEGIDPSPSAVRTARAHGLAAQVGTLEARPSGIGRFDLVILSHVLEHVPAPAGVLGTARDLLRPSGQLYIEVPDAERYDHYLVEPFNDINLEHINHFSIGHLDALLARHGYRSVDTGSRDFLLTEDWPFPAVYGRWTVGRSPVPARPGGGALERSVARYVAGSVDLVERIDRFLLDRLDPHEEVVVRGLGYRAWTLLGVSALRRFNVVRYVDPHPPKQKWTLAGVPVVGPAEDLGSGLPVVVLAYQAEAAIRREYEATSPGRRVIGVGRSRELPAPTGPARPGR